MRNARILIGRDFFARVKGPSFIITTLLGILVIVGLSFGPLVADWATERFDSSQLDLLLLDNTNEVAPTIMEIVNERQQGGQEISITELDSVTQSEAIAQMHDSAKTGLLVVNYGENQEYSFTMHTTNPADMNQNSTVQGIANAVMTRVHAQELGLSLEEVSRLHRGANMQVTHVTRDSEHGRDVDAAEHGQSMVLAYFLLFMIYMALIMYGNMVASGVAEEKSSRIMEVMVSTVKPFDLMIGKIIGIGSLGLLQFIIWIGTGLIMAGFQNLGFSLGQVPITVLLWFGLFFFLGYIFYATLFAAGGAVVSRVEEVQQVVTIMMMGIIVGFFVSFISFANPNGAIATTASFIPFFSPMVMFARVTLGNPSLLQVILSVFILIVSIIISTWLAARVYRVGILMYGKRPNFKEVFRYIMNAS